MTQKEHGKKRDNKKIDIYVDGKYICTTTWARTCKEAVEHFGRAYKHMLIDGKVTAHYK
jgi:hypothetical protein